jgi:hypothetical protein
MDATNTQRFERLTGAKAVIVFIRSQSRERCGSSARASACIRSSNELDSGRPSLRVPDVRPLLETPRS